MNYRNIIKLLVSIVVAQSAGIIGSLSTVSAIPNWYEGLVRPAISPPNWVFGPVWVTLYTLIGIALYLIWQKGLDNKRVRFAFAFFVVHLVLNASWSLIFFGLQNILLALVVIVLLLLMIIDSMALFWRIDRWATYLLVPYLLWVSFATVLNYLIFQLNV